MPPRSGTIACSCDRGFPSIRSYLGTTQGKTTSFSSIAKHATTARWWWEWPPPSLQISFTIKCVLRCFPMPILMLTHMLGMICSLLMWVSIYCPSTGVFDRSWLLCYAPGGTFHGWVVSSRQSSPIITNPSGIKPWLILFSKNTFAVPFYCCFPIPSYSSVVDFFQLAHFR